MNNISPTQSPTPSKKVLPEILNVMDFYNAIKLVMKGQKITKLEWNNKEFYGVLDEDRIKLHKDDGKLYDWILSYGDVSGEDYITI